MNFQPGEDSTQRDRDGCEPSWHAKALKIGSALALLAGISVSAVLVVYHSFFAVFDTARRISWGLSLTISIVLLGTAINSIAWRILFRSEKPGFTRLLFLVRWIRDSVNYLLPSAALGGDIAGIRLLVARGRDLNICSAIIVVDKTLEAVGLLFFGLAGTIILIGDGEQYTSVYLALLGLAAVASMVLALYLAQRWGLLKVIDKAVMKIMRKCGGESLNESPAIHDTVWAIYADRKRLIISLLLHILAWMSGVLQVWIILRFMGHDIGWQGAFIIESLCQMARAAAFVMPASLGAQEAAYMGAGMLVGVPPAVGLALSLIQRVNDVSASTLGLFLWQGFEGHGLWMRIKTWKHDHIEKNGE